MGPGEVAPTTRPWLSAAQARTGSAPASAVPPGSWVSPSGWQLPVEVTSLMHTKSLNSTLTLELALLRWTLAHRLHHEHLSAVHQGRQSVPSASVLTFCNLYSNTGCHRYSGAFPGVLLVPPLGYVEFSRIPGLICNIFWLALALGYIAHCMTSGSRAPLAVATAASCFSTLYRTVWHRI